MAEADGIAPPIERLLEDVEDALTLLTAAEDALHPPSRVLVVDDDARLAEVTARGLRRLGYEAESTASLPKVRQTDVLVVDLGLLDGLDESALAEVRAARPIVVTGATGRASRALAATVEASDYFVKPVELEELAAAIRRRMAPSPK